MPDRQARYREIDAKSVTRIPGITDPWFLGRYGMNLYRGCEHGCLYCDGRAERYYVQGEFDRDIVVKRNAIEILDRELARIREPGFLFLGGGVCDAYQPADARYALSRGVLDLALKHRLPVHVLTKGALVERDLDRLEQINAATRVILSLSMQTIDDRVRARFEPGAAPIDARWRLMARARERGFGIGLMAMPVLPGISDSADAIERLVAAAAERGVDFICFGGLTLRPGRQYQTYMDAIGADYPEHVAGYTRLYRDARASGGADARYVHRVDARFRAALDRHRIPARMPRRLFTGLVPLYTEVAVVLEHLQFARSRTRQHRPDLTRAGWAIQQWARQRLAKHRSRHYDWHLVEHTFRAAVRDRSLPRLTGMDPAAWASVEALTSVIVRARSSDPGPV